MKAIIAINILWCLPNITMAQSDWWKNESAKDSSKIETVEPGKVTVIKSSKLKKLIAFKGEAIPPAFEPTMDGFRIQIFFDQERKAINEARVKFLEQYPNEKTYVIYKAPNYNLLIGDFRDELAAEKKRAKIANEFPESIIMKSRIHLPKVNGQD